MFAIQVIDNIYIFSQPADIVKILVQDKVEFLIAYNIFSLDPQSNFTLLPIERTLTDLGNAFRGRQRF